MLMMLPHHLAIKKESDRAPVDFPHRPGSGAGYGLVAVKPARGIDDGMTWRKPDLTPLLVLK
ncbi:hypothetical protein SPF06_21205 [Sinomonas sp. JGH33]|uniref:Uncharacterized protein n=1 Tax=Sinomonas terricola TaxID=3110330 RepID=A0ABU5TC26_9MICC|nr:hypothetical protein [Sinomonas sp. JGH33]MEA5457247.1 hypothetical protein [Sinomonas sp. JGH33]